MIADLTLPQGAAASSAIIDSLNPQVKNPLWSALLAAIIIVLIVVLIFKLWEAYRSSQVLGIVIAALLLSVVAAPEERRWLWLLCLLPSLLVGYQVFYLWLYHPKSSNGSKYRIDQTQQEESKARAQATINKQFGLKTLFIRYGLPAFMLGIAGNILLNVLMAPETYWIPLADKLVYGKILLGMKFGALGAYVYVLLELGRRTFRHDITGASAMWCLVTLILGPILAALVAVLGRIEPPQTGAGSWGVGVVLFFAGFAPRRVMSAIEQAAMQLLKTGPPTVVETRLTPLSKIRGINPQIEERLSEEGILDANALAAAEPIRLVRNTSFDMRQILSWIDEALLIVTLPKNWEALEEEGITGAIDLAWCYEQCGSNGQTPSDTIRHLATKAKLDPASLLAVAQRLSQDKQVSYIWTLYNDFTEYSGGAE